jgi:hypothetical protein
MTLIRFRPAGLLGVMPDFESDHSFLRKDLGKLAVLLCDHDISFATIFASEEFMV